MPYKNPEDQRAQRKRHYEANKDRYKAWRAKWKAENSDRHAEIVRAWHEANPERVREIKRDSAKRNPRKQTERQREAAAARIANWMANNQDKRRQYVMNRRASKATRTPQWFGEFDEFVVLEAHRLAVLRQAITGGRWQVDHVVPLNGKAVSGLHVASNLQVIPSYINREKSNRYNGEPEFYFVTNAPVTDTFAPAGA